MKSKITLGALLFLFSSPVFAGLCAPVTQIYINSETTVEKQLPCGSLLGKLTDIPFSTTSFHKSEVIPDGFCAPRNMPVIQELTFQDFSTFDAIKIITNTIFALALMLLPFIFFVIVSKEIKILWIRIIFDIVLIFPYVAWIFILWGFFGAC